MLQPLPACNGSRLKNLPRYQLFSLFRDYLLCNLWSMNSHCDLSGVLLPPLFMPRVFVLARKQCPSIPKAPDRTWGKTEFLKQSYRTKYNNCDNVSLIKDADQIAFPYYFSYLFLMRRWKILLSLLFRHWSQYISATNLCSARSRSLSNWEIKLRLDASWK